MSLNQIYGYLEAINSEGDKDIEKSMNDPDTELIDQSSMEKGDVDSDLSPIKKMHRNRHSCYINFDNN